MTLGVIADDAVPVQSGADVPLDTESDASRC